LPTNLQTPAPALLQMNSQRSICISNERSQNSPLNTHIHAIKSHKSERQRWLAINFYDVSEIEISIRRTRVRPTSLCGARSKRRTLNFASPAFGEDTHTRASKEANSVWSFDGISQAAALFPRPHLTRSLSANVPSQNQSQSESKCGGCH